MGREAKQIVLRRQRDDEMASAAVIQRAFLPKVADFVAETGLDVSAAMTPARDVGGDFFDLVRLADGRSSTTSPALRCGGRCGRSSGPARLGGNAGARRLGALGQAVGAAHATVALSTVP